MIPLVSIFQFKQLTIKHNVYSIYFFVFLFVEILPQEVLENIFGITAYLHWLIRYQIHLKCRGILSSKGYLLRINKSNVKS